MAPLELHENLDDLLITLKFCFGKLIANSAFISAAEAVIPQLLQLLLHFSFDD